MASPIWLPLIDLFLLFQDRFLRGLGASKLGATWRIEFVYLFFEFMDLMSSSLTDWLTMVQPSSEFESESLPWSRIMLKTGLGVGCTSSTLIFHGHPRLRGGLVGCFFSDSLFQGRPRLRFTGGGEGLDSELESLRSILIFRTSCSMNKAASL